MADGNNDNEKRDLSRRKLLQGVAVVSTAGIAAASIAEKMGTPLASGAAAETMPSPNDDVQLYLKDSRPHFPPPPTAPKDAPNIIFLVLDDVGFSDLGCYGSEIPTPGFDAIASGGLRYTNFRTTAMCSPTRASLLTGLNHHSAGMGWLADIDNGFEGYRGNLTHDAATMAELLRSKGWSTLMVGKWHLNNAQYEGAMSLSDNWPGHRGFERSYWFQGHSTDYFNPSDMFEGSEPVEVPKRPDYYTTDDFTDRAMTYIRTQKAQYRDKPFFMHLAFNGAHSPLQARADDRDFFKGKYDIGWDRVREDRLARQKALGIVPKDTPVPPRNPGIKAWDSLSADERKAYARYMEVYAGIVRRIDYNVQRLTGLLAEMNLLDNTLIFVISDNGASPEGTVEGTPNIFASAFSSGVPLPDVLKLYNEMGEADTFPHYPMGWAMASNTPFRMYKQYTFLGGISDPLLVHWPKGIAAKGETRTQFVHVMDIYPTVLEAIGIEPLKTYQGREMKPLEGTSFRYTFENPGAPTQHTSQYFELGGQRAMYVDGWHIVNLHPVGSEYEKDQWELYHHAADFNEIQNLAAAMPDKVKELEAEWFKAAKRYNVLPLDDRNFVIKMLALRLRDTPRPHWEFYPPIERLSSSVSPVLAGRDHTITVDLDRTKHSDDGVLVSYGSIHWGFVLYVKDGRLVYETSLRPYASKMVSSRPLPLGQTTVKYVQTMSERPFKGAGALYIGDQKVAEQHSDRMLFGSAYKGIDIGRDGAAHVTRSYKAPFEFKGRIARVGIDVDTSPPTMDEMQRFMRMMKMRA